MTKRTTVNYWWSLLLASFSRLNGRAAADAAYLNLLFSLQRTTAPCVFFSSKFMFVVNYWWFLLAFSHLNGRAAADAA
jgi:hypothetical protein